MIHHDARDYNVAVGEAAAKFQTKLEEMIHASVPRVGAVLEQVQADVPEDAIVLGRSLKFEASDSATGPLLMRRQGGALRLHEHAFGQVCERTKVRHLAPVLRELRSKGTWGAATAADTLNDIYAHLNGDRFLVRSIRGEARGFLSDSFKRLDSRPLVDAFVTAIQRYGARPVDGFALATKVNLRAILPFVFEPFPGEVMAFGAQLSDSDFGDGRLVMSGFVLRMWCTNLATTEDVLSQVHVGRKLSDNLVLSQQTMELDTATTRSAIGDVAHHVLGAGAVNQYLALVRAANEAKIAPAQIATWVKANLTKAEGERAVEKFRSADVELLPPGDSKWRWSNALSWLANETEDEHRKLELQDLAGGVLKPALLLNAPARQ